MSIDLEGLEPADGTIPRLDFELTEGCDHGCSHCYNVWNGDSAPPPNAEPALDTPALQELMSKAVAVSGARHITLTGGEPLLRKQAMQIVRHATELVPSVTLITNGSHVGPDTAAKFAEWGVRGVQLTLLAGDRELHDRLKGAVCFDDTVRAALDLIDAGVRVQVCFVAMAENRREFRKVMELCVALGIDDISYNRMSPTGRAIHHMARLMPTPAQIEADLETAEVYGRAWGVRVATAMPIPPCIVRTSHLTWVRTGACSTGSKSPNIVLDARGNVRSCNLSANELGNLLTDEWSDIIGNSYFRTFKATVPEMCRGCTYEASCQGGCKESGHSAFGSHSQPEPLLWMATQKGARQLVADRVRQEEGP